MAARLGKLPIISSSLRPNPQAKPIFDPPTSPPETFVEKWKAFELKERSAAQESTLAIWTDIFGVSGFVLAWSTEIPED